MWGVDLGGDSVALDTAQHRAAGEPGLVSSVHDFGVERFVVPQIALSDENREPHSPSGVLHQASSWARVDTARVDQETISPMPGGSDREVPVGSITDVQ